jgi:hypothetical protein
MIVSLTVEPTNNDHKVYHTKERCPSNRKILDEFLVHTTVQEAVEKYGRRECSLCHSGNYD